MDYCRWSKGQQVRDKESVCVRGGIIHIVQVDGSKENVCFENLSSGISNESHLLKDIGSLAIFPEVLWYKEKPAGTQTVVTGTHVHTSEPDE